VHLDKGETIDITARTPASDVYFTVLTPREFDSTFRPPDADDGGGGLFDLDAEEKFTAGETGTYRIVVGTNDPITSGYTLSVTLP